MVLLFDFHFFSTVTGAFLADFYFFFAPFFFLRLRGTLLFFVAVALYPLSFVGFPCGSGIFFGYCSSVAFFPFFSPPSLRCCSGFSQGKIFPIFPFFLRAYSRFRLGENFPPSILPISLLGVSVISKGTGCAFVFLL